MCGIVAILEGSAVDVPAGTVERMSAALAHRGPDAQACVKLPGCQLGHTRLSVIDIEGGAQPMADPSGRYTVVFNGEIYNFRELRAELERDGAVFRTRSDTEVLLHAYRRFGRGMLSRLNGQFAFAIWDTTERTLFAARDRFGEKPLYWARTSTGHLLLASEMKAILASGLLSPRIDRTSVDAYLGLFYVPPDRTIYENVHALAPAHAMIVRDGGVSETWRYWEPKFSCNEASLPEAVDEVRRLIGRAVGRQTVADVPVGAFLSGGLDSSTIVALMSQESTSPVQTFSVGFGDLIDELPFAREVARGYGTDHHELQMDIDVESMLHRMLDVYDEPFADSSNIPTYLVAEYARRGVKVVLSGDGGDEIFGGYSWYTPLLEQVNGEESDWWDRHVGAATGLTADRSTLWGGRGHPPAASVVRQRFLPGDEVRTTDRACHFDAQCYLPGDILVKVDRAAMAHGLEARAPFLDVDLVEFVLGLPGELRFHGKTLKHLLRAACGDLWPESIRGRGKQGFGAPVRHWIQKPDVQRLWDRVIRPGSALCALLPGVPAAAADLRPQRKWTLLCLGLWLEKHSECLSNVA